VFLYYGVDVLDGDVGLFEQFGHVFCEEVPARVLWVVVVDVQRRHAEHDNQNDNDNFLNGRIGQNLADLGLLLA